MSQILQRFMLMACLVSASLAMADDDAQMSPVPPSEMDHTESIDQDAGELVEPARLEPSVEYYDGASTAHPQGGPAMLFYNYYATPGNPAAMYPAPYPTPASIGHVYYTYQPFLPHEFLYPHFRVYYTYKGNYHGYEHLQGRGTYNKTTVRWTRGHAPLSWRPKIHGSPRLPAIPTHCYHEH